MKKILFILVALMAFAVASAQNYKTHDIILKDSTRYIIFYIDDYSYKAYHLTDADTIDYNDILTVRFKSEWFQLNKTFSNINFTVGFGCGYNVDKSGMIMNISTTLCGFVFDMATCYRNHGSDWSVGIWNDDRYRIYRFGFDIPVYKNFSVAPLIGVYNYEKGYTNGYNYSIDNNGNLNNSFYATKSKSCVDYGVRLSIYKETPNFGSIGLTFNASLTISNHTTAGCIGVGMSF